MRFLFSDASRARRLARLLQTELSRRHGVVRSLAACRQLFAEACGYPNFHELETSAGKSGVSVVDEGSPAVTVAVRKVQQRGALLKAGLASDVVDALLDTVRFTGARRPSLSEAVPSEAFTSPRRQRIREHRGSGFRAGNYESGTLHGPDDEFLGVLLGTDRSYEHDYVPDELLEALGIPDGAVTVGAARARPGTSCYLHQDRSGHGATEASVLDLNPPEWDLRQGAYAYSPDMFTGTYRENSWKMDRRTAPLGLLTGWSYRQAVLVAFDEEDRLRINVLAEAVREGNLAVVANRRLGLVFLLADAFDVDTPVGDLLEGLASARSTVRRRRDRGCERVSIDPAGCATTARPMAAFY